MPVVSCTKDPEALTLTLVDELSAPPERIWQVWVDPRQLERWWGPPTWPATFEEHDTRPGGRSSYYMTGPEGEKARGWWQFVSLEEPRSIEFEDGFSDESGEPDDAMPRMTMRVALEPSGTGTRMTVTTLFRSVEEMQQLLTMGMAEGLEGAAGQIDALIAG